MEGVASNLIIRSACWHQLVTCVVGVLVLPRCEDDGKPMAMPYRFSNQRLKDLGLEFTPLEKSLYEAVVSMQKKGHLPIIAKQPITANL